jgi:type II secretory pathway pseudopilin PulG
MVGDSPGDPGVHVRGEVTACLPHFVLGVDSTGEPGDVLAQVEQVQALGGSALDHDVGTPAVAILACRQGDDEQLAAPRAHEYAPQGNGALPLLTAAVQPARPQGDEIRLKEARIYWEYNDTAEDLGVRGASGRVASAENERRLLAMAGRAMTAANGFVSEPVRNRQSPRKPLTTLPDTPPHGHPVDSWLFLHSSGLGGRDKGGKNSTGARMIRWNQEGVNPGPAGSTSGRPSAGGFTMLELMLVVTVLLVAFGAFSQSVVQSMALNATNRESALAQGGLREMIEILNGGERFEWVFSRYNSDPADDPPLPSPGSNFSVAGLAPIEGDPDGFVGEIVFPTLVNVAGLELRENLALPELGMPRDLNGDGVVDAVDHSGDYRLLPVIVRLEWQGRSGQRSAEIRTFLADR